MSGLKQLISEVHRRSLWQVLLVYVGASWVVLEAADVMVSRLALPEWVYGAAMVLLLVGLPIVLATAFVQEGVTPSRPEPPGVADDPAKTGTQPHEATGVRRLFTWRNAISGGVLALALWGVVATGWYVVIKGGPGHGPSEAVAHEAPSGIAVVPFTVSGSDLEVWREGMMDLFSTSLDGVGGYRTIDSRTVLARWHEALEVEAVPDLDLTLEVAELTGARYALLGSAVSVAGNVRLAGEIYDLQSGAGVGRGRVEGPPDSVLALVDALSVALMRDLLTKTGQHIVSPNRVASLTTPSLPALQAYLEGEVKFRRSDFRAAIEAYGRAIAEDSTFALALWRLASASAWVGGYDYWGLDRSSLERAAEHIDRLPTRDADLLRAFQAFEAGDREDLPLARAAVRKYPDDPDAWYTLGEVFVHSRTAVLHDVSEGIEALEKAVALDPTFAPYYIHLIELAIAQADTAGALDLLRTYMNLAGPTARPYLPIAVPLFVGDSARRAATLAVMDTVDVEVLIDLYSNLDWQTEALDAQELRVRKITGRAEEIWADFDIPTNVLGQLIQALIAQGKFAEARDLLLDPRVPADARAEEGFVLNALVRGVSPDELDRWLHPDNCDGGAYCTLAVGAYAAERGRWDVLAAITDRGREAAEELRSQERPIPASYVEVSMGALEGYGLMQRGRFEEAIETLNALQGRKFGPDHWVRWWLAEAYVAAGRPQAAIPYFRSLWLNRFKFYGAYRLGELYTELGRPDEAREAYESFLRMWEDADPGLPQLARAREALRLGTDR